MPIKRGDIVFVGPGSVTWVSDKNPDRCDPSIDLQHYGVTAEQSEIHPWHPLLPSIAIWLNETPGGDHILQKVMDRT